MKHFLLKIFDNNYAEKYYQKQKGVDGDTIDWFRVIPFILIHFGALAALWTHFEWYLVWVALILFVIRMFAITGFYHRYFAHKTFKTSRLMQFIFAFIGSTAAQRGPIWWASHHRRHHLNSDRHNDHHSPHTHHFLWSHMGWFLAKKNFLTDRKVVRDLIKFKELVLIDRFDWFPPVLLLLSLFVIGEYLSLTSGISGLNMVIWGFCVSTILVYHCTFAVNSIAHLWGTQRYNTKEESKNNFLVALLTFGEGWHNNHHHYPGSIRQGFYWWEVDLTYYALKFLSFLGIVYNLRTVSKAIRQKHN
ncbi:stearoyl-CoA 9-desaturase [Methylophilales bacterium MBRSG12]|uniref:Stearoyl-CoA 9-desaturase n=1 Tax=Methylophilales bacterium MBRS-H7 TaxID=1623450 RepID=A0A0H4JD27_9PROT|nr:stearoyl-CoA 9-desaturase [Methylophilales bacterium MBRSF5]AKO66387.1 stearoyl-CoA 9-desaturase [Methylophilales bacterium MBRS-H7]AKO67702.1 stearoyl-CoA 9-desaturase [Methylophilales bacterium MBRSG12]